VLEEERKKEESEQQEEEVEVNDHLRPKLACSHVATTYPTLTS
jgi:hypothetical protein